MAEEFGEDLDAALPELRELALVTMRSRCRVLRFRGRAPLDRDAGRQLPTYEVLHVDWPVRIRGARSGPSTTRTEQVGESEVQVAARVAVLPHLTRVDVDDLVVIDAGETAGTVWRVVDGDWSDGQTSLRVPIEVSTLDDDWTEWVEVSP